MKNQNIQYATKEKRKEEKEKEKRKEKKKKEKEKKGKKKKKKKELKLRFYRLMIEYDVHEENFMQVCKHHYEIFKTKSIEESDHDWKEVFCDK